MIESITQTDLSILLWIQANLRNSIVTPFLQFISFLGNGGLFFIVLNIILLFLVRHRKLAVSLAFAQIIQAITVNLIVKKLIARPRPYSIESTLIPLVTQLKDYSFPSGHTATAVCMTVVCYLTDYKKAGHISLVFSILMAFSRMYVGVHYPTDIIGGILTGILCAIAGVKLTPVVCTFFEEHFSHKAK